MTTAHDDKIFPSFLNRVFAVKACTRISHAGFHDSRREETELVPIFRCECVKQMGSYFVNYVFKDFNLDGVQSSNEEFETISSSYSRAKCIKTFPKLS